MSEWTAKQSSDRYQVSKWGADFFSVSSRGELLVHPRLQDASAPSVLGGLNPEQRRAITHGEGPLLVVAARARARRA